MNIDLIPLGNPPEHVNVIVEIPQGSSIKYEIDKKSGAVFVDRFIHTAMVYPFNYGFIPHTMAEDGDPVDVLLEQGHGADLIVLGLPTRSFLHLGHGVGRRVARRASCPVVLVKPGDEIRMAARSARVAGPAAGPAGVAA